MKKVLLLSVFAAGALMAGAAGTAGNVVTTSNGSLEIAMDGEKFYNCAYTVTEDAVEYTILNPDFSVLKNFTIKGVRNVVENGAYTREESMYVSTVDLDDVVATRGLFTNDGKWCVIFRSGADNGMNRLETYTVYNEDGKKVFDLPASRSVYGDWEETDCGQIYLSNITSGAPVYVTREGSDSSTGDDVNKYTVWSFDAAGTNAPVAKTTLKAYPNPLPAGAPLTVELPAPADARTVFIVNDMNGRQVLRREVAKGESVYRVSPRFGHGAYVYTVIYGDGSSFTGKLAAE